MGRPCTQRSVLILDRENTAPIVQERLKRLRIQDGSALKIWGSWLEEPAPEPGAMCILEWVQTYQPKPLIILDSLIAFLDGDENDAKVVRAFMQQIRRLADVGAAVIVLHHTGKGETSRKYRGSSDFKASVNVGYTLVNLGSGELDRLRLEAFKTRFTASTDLILHYADGRFVSDDRPIAVQRTVTEQLTDLLRSNPGIRSSDFENLAAQGDLGRDRARRFIRDGLATGRVEQEGGGKNAKSNYLIGPWSVPMTSSNSYPGVSCASSHSYKSVRNSQTEARTRPVRESRQAPFRELANTFISITYTDCGNFRLRTESVCGQPREPNTHRRVRIITMNVFIVSLLPRGLGFCPDRTVASSDPPLLLSRLGNQDWRFDNFSAVLCVTYWLTWQK